MSDQRAFDFGGAETMAGDVEYVVDATGDPVVAVLVAPRAVAGEIAARERFEVGVDEALMIAEPSGVRERRGTYRAGKTKKKRKR